MSEPFTSLSVMWPSGTSARPSGVAELDDGVRGGTDPCRGISQVHRDALRLQSAEPGIETVFRLTRRRSAEYKSQTVNVDSQRVILAQRCADSVKMIWIHRQITFEFSA